MAKNWYIIHVFSGYENKVSTYLNKNLKSNLDFGQAIGEIKVPIEDSMEMRNGKKRNIKKKFFPGYILLELDLPDDTEGWKKIVNAITQIQGVTGFLGSMRNQRPRPIPIEDAKTILQKTGDIKIADTGVPKVNYVQGESVKVVDGPFQNFNGVVEEINFDKGKVKVVVEIFGRSTPVELDFLQVERI